MLLAIDVGNTQTVYGLWDGAHWVHIWRRATRAEETEDEVAVWLCGAFDLANIPFRAESMIVATVVPAMKRSLRRLGERHLQVEPKFLERGDSVGIPVKYDPPHGVGADRLANALAAIALGSLPAVVVDLGTATTFDVISAQGEYLGGAIMPGFEVSASALAGRTARLPSVDIAPPEKVIGRTTNDAIRSGIVLGQIGAIDRILEDISEELGSEINVIVTGGLGQVVPELSKYEMTYEPNLTLDGLVIAEKRLRPKD